MKHLYSLVFVFVALASFNLSIAQNIVPNLTTADALAGNCSGSATVTPTGGSGSYSYLWSTGDTTNSINLLCPGTYSATVYDATDTVTVNFTINDPCIGFTGIYSGTPASGPGICDGSATFTPIGGTPPYIYNWNSGATTQTITNVCPGNYTATAIDANGCMTQNIVVVVGNPPPLSINVTTTDDLSGNCSGSASAVASGGSGGYTYLWNTGETTSSISNLCSGIYTVMVQDSNYDTASVSFVITNSCLNFSGTLSFTPTSGPAICDGSITVNPVYGTAPYTFNWSIAATTQTVTNFCAGTYNISVICTDMNGCSVTISDSIVLTSTPCGNFPGTISSTPTSGPAICDGTATFTPSGGTAPYAYTWSNGVTTPSLSNLCVGNYTVTCTDANGCTTTLTVSVSDSSNTTGNFYADLVSTDDLTNNCSGSASVFPNGGIAPYTVLWSDGQSGTSASNLCAGIYSVTVWDSGMDSTTVNFVIADSSTTYGNNPFPNGVINDTLYTDLVTNCFIDYSVIDSASLYQAVYDSINQNLYVTWAIYSPTDTVYISDTLGLAGNSGYYALTISVYCPNKSGNDFFQIESVIYFDGSIVWLSPTLGTDEKELLNQVVIYPNPFSNFISIDNKDGAIQSIKLIDLNGRVLSEMNLVHSGLVEIGQLETISAGTYLLILSGESTSKTYKVIK